jgi:hypothetical protein
MKIDSKYSQAHPHLWLGIPGVAIALNTPVAHYIEGYSLGVFGFLRSQKTLCPVDRVDIHGAGLPW